MQISIWTCKNTKKYIYTIIFLTFVSAIYGKKFLYSFPSAFAVFHFNLLIFFVTAKPNVSSCRIQDVILVTQSLWVVGFVILFCTGKMSLRKDVTKDEHQLPFRVQRNIKWNNNSLFYISKQCNPRTMRLKVLTSTESIGVTFPETF